MIVEQLPIKLIQVGKDFMYHVSQLKATHPIALGDCFAATLVIERHCPVITGDKEFKRLQKLLTVDWLSYKFCLVSIGLKREVPERGHAQAKCDEYAAGDVPQGAAARDSLKPALNEL